MVRHHQHRLRLEVAKLALLHRIFERLVVLLAELEILHQRVDRFVRGGVLAALPVPLLLLLSQHVRLDKLLHQVQPDIREELA